MKGELQNKKVLVRGKGVFIGVDVHKESCHITARAEGEEFFYGGIPTVNIMPFGSSWVILRIAGLR